MTPDQALHILNALTERATGTRADHALGLDALETLKAAIPSELASTPINIAPLHRAPLTQAPSNEADAP